MKTLLKFKNIDIEGDGCHLLATIKINNKDAKVIIDTGASKTAFDNERILSFIDNEKMVKAEQLSSGIGTNTLESHTVLLKEIKLGKLIINNYSAVAIDMFHVNESYSMLNLDKVDGVLGGDILKEYNAVINYKTEKISFELSDK